MQMSKSIGAGTQTAGGDLNIFLDRPFTCDTTVVGFKFRASQSGEVVFGIWAPDSNRRYMKLVWKQSVRATRAPEVVYRLDTPVQVHSGYLIGLQYPEAGRRGSNTGIIPYYDSRDSLYGTGYTRDELSRIYSVGIADRDLPIGTRKPMNALAGVTRLPSLQILTDNSGNYTREYVIILLSVVTTHICYNRI